MRIRDLRLQLEDLELRREKNKAELFDKEALQLRQTELYYEHGESTPLPERRALASEIATLAADRQRSKVELILLKRSMRTVREVSMVDSLVEAMKKHGHHEELSLIRHNLKMAEKACSYCDDTGDVHTHDGEWRGVCCCEAGQAIKESPWRPIETAPEDTEVWAFNGTQGLMKLVDIEDWRGWIWVEELMNDVDPSPEIPTHWMPKPDDPVVIF